MAIESTNLEPTGGNADARPKRIIVLLRAYGKLAGRFPLAIFGVSFAICLGVSLGGWIGYWGHYRSDLPFEKEWGVRGGQLEKEYNGFVDSHNNEPWAPKSHITMVVGKEEGQDVINPEVFAETEALYGRFFNISVVTGSGKTYTTWDLCDRGSMPDKPADFPPGSCAAFANDTSNAELRKGCFPTPIFPCKIISPNQCFAEYVDYLHPSYALIDPIIDVVLPASMGGAPYSTRPSWKGMDGAGMKRETSKLRSATGTQGCPWWTEMGTFTPAMWGAGVEWNANETEMSNVQGMRWIFSMDAPRRVAFRMSMTQPEKADETEIAEALKLHAEAWDSEVYKFASTAHLVEIANLKPDFLDAIEEELEKPPWVLIIIGGVIFVFAICVFVSFTKPLTSKVSVGIMGLNAVGTAAVTTGGLILITGYHFNSAMMAALPFLALGLGMNDAFVLIRYFSELGVDYISSKDEPEIIGEVFAQAGAGVLLTSVCNSIAFGLGSSLPVPGMSDFCIGAALVSAVNFFVIVTQFLPSLVLEVRRIKAKRPELHCFVCQRRYISAADQNRDSAVSETSGIEERINTFLETKAARWLVKAPVYIGLTVLASVFLAVCCVFVANKSIGYKPADIVPTHMHEHRAFEMLFDRFSFFPAQIVFKDVDVPSNQVEMLELYQAVTNSTPRATKNASPVFLTMFYNYLAAAGAAVGVQLTDPSYTDPVLAPYGIASSDTKTFYQLYHQWSSFPLGEPLQAYLPGGNAFVYADMVQTNEFNYHDNSNKELEMSFFPFFQVNIQDNNSILQSIEEVRNTISKSSLGQAGKAFVHGDIFTYWQVFLEMEPIMWRVFAINLAVIFVVTLILLHSPLAAIVTAVACAMIVLELYGICMLFLNFNIFIAATLLAAAGMSVEFVAHVVAAFSIEQGTLEQRLGVSMRHTFVPIVLGSVSTVLGILPMAFHPVPFIVKYQFVPFALAVAFGTVNGMLFLPAFLALIGSLQERLQERLQFCRVVKKQEIATTTDETNLAPPSQFEVKSNAVEEPV